MYSVTYHPREKDITRQFDSEEEAENFKNNMRSLGFKIVGTHETENKPDYKIEWR